MLFSAEQAFVGREEIRAPLKTPAWEANIVGASVSSYGECSFRHISSKFAVLDYISNMSYFSLL